MWYHVHNFSSFWLWSDFIVSVLFWGGVLFLAAWAVRNYKYRRGYHETPLDILKRRLASGEITPEEFDNLRKALET